MVKLLSRYRNRFLLLLLSTSISLYLIAASVTWTTKTTPTLLPLDYTYHLTTRSQSNISRASAMHDPSGTGEIHGSIKPVVNTTNNYVASKNIKNIPIIPDHVMKLLDNMFTVKQVPKKKNRLFRSVLTTKQKDVLLDLVIAATDVFHKYNISYFMYGGTLLGSYRHHNIIPWDDDVDFVFNSADREDLFYALQTLKPEYMVVLAGPRFKFFSIFSAQTSHYPWGWPYVDIHFYNENSTHVWDSASEFMNYVYPKSIVFPLHLRPFDSLELYAPKDTYAYLLSTYPNHECQTYNYSHKYESLSLQEKESIPCQTLKNKVAFVHRTRDSFAGIRETLMLGSRAVHSVVVDEPSYAVTDPYTLQLL